MGKVDSVGILKADAGDNEANYAKCQKLGGGSVFIFARAVLGRLSLEVGKHCHLRLSISQRWWSGPNVEFPRLQNTV